MDVQTLNKKFQKELLSGITALVLLSTLDQSDDPMYGYQIAKSLESENEESFIKQGALYPVLRSLEKSGLLSSSVEPSVSGPPRKYYNITPLGSKTLEEWKAIWEQFKSFADNILEGVHHDN
jgi:PadR family transcriptional regulator, regulatory protein PadR